MVCSSALEAVTSGGKTEAKSTALWVNRDDMVAVLGNENYDEILKALREAIGTTKIFWGGKNDDFLFLESF